jgi:hypothetical protein
MIKTKFRILIYVPIVLLGLLVLSSASFLLALTLLNGQEPVILIIIAGIMLVILPSVLFIWSVKIMWPCVEFSKDGLEKTLFGKKLRFISWDEIYEIRRINAGITEWIFFSMTNLENKSIDKCRNRKDNIFIVSTIDVEKAIKHFAPTRLV